MWRRRCAAGERTGVRCVSEPRRRREALRVPCLRSGACNSAVRARIGGRVGESGPEVRDPGLSSEPAIQNTKSCGRTKGERRKGGMRRWR